MERFFDSLSLDKDHLETDICIIGGGSAGIVLATRLSNQFNVLVIESGGIDGSTYYTDLNDATYISNFYYRKGFSNRCRHIGGSTNLWAGRLVPYVFDDEIDREWGSLANILPSFYSKAAETLGIPYELIKDYDFSKQHLIAAWAQKTERFNMESSYLKSPNFDIIYNLTFIGSGKSLESTIKELYFKDKNNREIKIQAKKFIIACGGIESTRLLLLLKYNNPEIFSNNAKNNVGHYIMDHPKITHGNVKFEDLHEQIDDHAVKYYRHGRTKIGLKRQINNTRIYSNIIHKRSRIFEKAYARIAKTYMNYSKKFNNSSNQKKDVDNNLIYVIEPQEMMPYWSLVAQDKVSTVKSNFSKNNEAVLTTYLEMKPRKENYIYLDKNKYDKFNNPLPVLNLHISDEERYVIKRYYNELQNFFSKEKAKFYFNNYVISNTKNFTDASHHLGGVRYSSDEKKRVVNEDLSLSGCSNLHILSTAVFPTGGVENPTFLLVSLAHYLSDSIIKNYDSIN